MNRLLRRVPFLLLGTGAAVVFSGAVLHHVSRQDFRPLAAFCLPVLVVFFAFTSLLYLRGRSLAPGRDQRRTLYAAEWAMRATAWYLTGIAAGAGTYGSLRILQDLLDWAAFPAPALLAFGLPWLLMQGGLLHLLRAVRVIAPQFFGRPDRRILLRRVAEAP